MKKTIYSAFFLSFVFSSNAQTPASAVTGGNNIQALIHADGLLFQNDENGQFNVPGGHSPIRAAGIWLGGDDPGGNLKGAFQMYRSDPNDFTPGIYGVEGDDWNRIWKVTGEDILIHRRDFNKDRIIDDTLSSIFGWPAVGNVFFKGIHGFDLPDAHYGLAPFHDEDGNNKYDPDKGDYPAQPMRGCEDIPDTPAEMLWFSCHDDTPHDFSGSYKARIGVQANLVSYRCKGNDYLNNTVFVFYKLINHSPEDLGNCHFGMFVDFELGCPEDDYVASIPERNIFFVYNSDDQDEDCEDYKGFGENPPAVAVRLVRGPLNENRFELPITALMQIHDSTALPGMRPPETDKEFYYYLTGNWKFQAPLTYGGNGFDPLSTEYTKILYPGHVFDSSGWSELTAGNTPGRRRMLAATGPFILQPGAVNEIVMSFTFLPGGTLPGKDNLWQLYNLFPDMMEEFLDHCFGPPNHVCTPDLEIPPPPPLPEEFILSPNPAKEWLKVEFRNFELVEAFEIYDALGRLVFETTTLNDEITVPVADFPKGTYFAVLKKKNGRVAKPFLVLRR
jgi:hypothetical protein